MAETFFLEVATPERMMVHEAVSSAQVPAANGYIGVLPGHAALLSELGEGELSYVVEGRRHKLEVRGGWMEISGDRTRVLADSAEVPDHEP